MPFMTEDDSVLVKYNEIWNKIKKTLNIKFHSMYKCVQLVLKNMLMPKFTQLH